VAVGRSNTFYLKGFFELPASQPRDNSKKNRSETPSTISSTSIQKRQQTARSARFFRLSEEKKGEGQLKIFEYPSEKRVVVVAAETLAEEPTKQKKAKKKLGPIYPFYPI